MPERRFRFAFVSNAVEIGDALKRAADPHTEEIIVRGATMEDAIPVAREVLRDGEALSANLRELSDSLRANAERLLLDIRAAHAEMSARLDRVDADVGAAVGRLDRRTPSAPSPSPEPEIPEFIPRRRR